MMTRRRKASARPSEVARSRARGEARGEARGGARGARAHLEVAHVAAIAAASDASAEHATMMVKVAYAACSHRDGTCEDAEAMGPSPHARARPDAVSTLRVAAVAAAAHAGMCCSGGTRPPECRARQGSGRSTGVRPARYSPAAQPASASLRPRVNRRLVAASGSSCRRFASRPLGPAQGRQGGCCAWRTPGGGTERAGCRSTSACPRWARA